MNHTVSSSAYSFSMPCMPCTDVSSKGVGNQNARKFTSKTLCPYLQPLLDLCHKGTASKVLIHLTLVPQKRGLCTHLPSALDSIQFLQERTKPTDNGGCFGIGGRIPGASKSTDQLRIKGKAHNTLTLMNSYHTDCLPFFFSYIKYSVRHASSLNLSVVKSSARDCEQYKPNYSIPR